MSDAPVVLANGALEAVVLPTCGGALLELALRRPDGNRIELLRTASRPWRDAQPEDTACFPLVPWSNRISGGGFLTAGGVVRLEPNRPNEPYPIHGEGWLLPWTVAERGDSRVALELDRADASPYRYTARLTYRLAGAALRMRLSVTHTGTSPMPYGLGFHPWFPFTPGVSLRASAKGMWQEREGHLPGEHGPVPAALDFASARDVPDRWVNNAFDGWDGRAELDWPDRGAHLTLECPEASYFVLYHPPAAAFVCFEPVTHPVDAFHLPPPRRDEGLTWLNTGETHALSCTLSASLGATERG